MNADKKNLKDEEIEELENSFDYMYEYLLDKMKKEYPVCENTYKRIKSKDVEKLNSEEKKELINGIINLLETGQGNLKVINLALQEGRKYNINFSTKRLQNMILIDKSVTGMYERRYKISNGMENNSSK